MSKAEKTLNQKAAITKHASEIYSQMAGKLPVTAQNLQGVRMHMETAIEHAELFHEILAEKGYDGGDRNE